MTELKLLVKDCGYPNSEELVRDRIAFSINSSSVREKLLSQGAEFMLVKAIDIARSHEIAQQQLKLISQGKDSSSNDTVHAVGRKSYKRKAKQRQDRTQRSPQRKSSQNFSLTASP